MFMILLVLTIPFYISSVFATTETIGQVEEQIANPALACIEKNKKSNALADIMDNDIIQVLEKIANVLQFTCTVWSTTESVISAFHAITGFRTDGTCTVPNTFICDVNKAILEVRKPIARVMDITCSLQTCALCNSKVGLLSPGQAIKAIGGEGIQKTTGDFINRFHLSPYDNIYVAIACMCPVAILFNLRKLKTIYQTYNCCVEQACANGMDTQGCEQQLAEATCMYWQGSIFKGLINIIMSLVSEFIAKEIFEKIFGELSKSDFVVTLYKLYTAYQKIQQLPDAWKKMQESFSEPRCEDLGFQELRDEQKQAYVTTLCSLVTVDSNNDGIAERVETRCDV